MNVLQIKTKLESWLELNDCENPAVIQLMYYVFKQSNKTKKINLNKSFVYEINLWVFLAISSPLFPSALLPVVIAAEYFSSINERNVSFSPCFKRAKDFCFTHG